jgi:hypothetical protein
MDFLRRCLAGAMAAPAGREPATPVGRAYGPAAVPTGCWLSCKCGAGPIRILRCRWRWRFRQRCRLIRVRVRGRPLCERCGLRLLRLLLLLRRTDWLLRFLEWQRGRFAHLSCDQKHEAGGDLPAET